MKMRAPRAVNSATETSAKNSIQELSEVGSFLEMAINEKNKLQILSIEKQITYVHKLSGYPF